MKEFRFNTRNVWTLQLLLIIIAIGFFGGIIQIFKTEFEELTYIHLISILYFIILPFIFIITLNQKIVINEDHILIKKLFKSKTHNLQRLKVTEIEQEKYSLSVDIKTKTETLLIFKSDSGISILRSDYVKDYWPLKKEIENILHRKINKEKKKLNWILKTFDHFY